MFTLTATSIIVWILFIALGIMLMIWTYLAYANTRGMNTRFNNIENNQANIGRTSIKITILMNKGWIIKETFKEEEPVFIASKDEKNWINIDEAWNIHNVV